MPSGIDALIEIGLGGMLKSIPGRRVESWNIWIDGEEVFVIPEPVEELGERATRVVSQPAFLEKVIEEASRYASFSFERGTRVRDLIRDAGGRVVGAELETENGPRKAWTDLVVGCDGRAPWCARARASSSSSCPRTTTSSGSSSQLQIASARGARS